MPSSDVPTAPVPVLGIMPPSVPEAVINPAKWMHDRLIKAIIDFEKKLADSEEIGAKLVNFGAHEIISITDVGYWGPDLIVFFGRNIEGQPVELLQHISQISILLVALKRDGDSDTPRRIGFALQKKLDQPEIQKAEV